MSFSKPRLECHHKTSIYFAFGRLGPWALISPLTSGASFCPNFWLEPLTSDPSDPKPVSVTPDLYRSQMNCDGILDAPKSLDTWPDNRYDTFPITRRTWLTFIGYCFGRLFFPRYHRQEPIKFTVLSPIKLICSKPQSRFQSHGPSRRKAAE